MGVSLLSLVLSNVIRMSSFFLLFLLSFFFSFSFFLFFIIIFLFVINILCRNSGTVQLYGCRLLYSILLWGMNPIITIPLVLILINLLIIDNHPHMKGGVECVLAAMRTYTYDVEIQEFTCRILAILADQGILSFYYHSSLSVLY